MKNYLLQSNSAEKQTYSMKRTWESFSSLVFTLAIISLIFSVSVQSQVVTPFTSVFSQNQKGTIVFVGNTLFTCSGSGCTGAQNGDNDPNNDFNMVNVDIDGDGSTVNSSSATFTLPSGASVLWAGLYWGGVSTSSSRNQIKFRTPAMGSYTTITGTVGSTSYGYQGYANVTSYVQAGGSGTYIAGNVQASTGSNKWAGWTLIIVIQDPSELLRNLTVFNGLALVNTSNSNVTFTISGFKTPLSGNVNTLLGVVAYDGDRGYTGDNIKLNSTTVTNSLNPNSDFFNSTISRLNAHVTTKTPNYVNQLGFDADVVDASNIIANGATSATVTLTTSSESYIPGAVTTVIELFAPDIKTTKVGRDVNGGFLEPGDTLEYTMVSKNIGNDGATLLVLKDTIPTIGTFVPGSLVISQGANAGTKSDGSGDDQAEYSSGSRSITFRLGTGANGSNGGTLAISESTTVKFKIRIDPASADQVPVHNQGTLSFTSATLSQPFVVNSFSADTVVVWASDLKVYKTASASTVQAGDNVTYTVKIKNFGKKDAASVILADTVPSGMTYVSSSLSQGTYSTSTGRWTVGSIPYGDSATMTMLVNATVGGTRKNKALIVQQSLPEPTPWDDSSSVTIAVIDTVAPNPPTISFPANGSSTNDNTPTVTGFAEALSKVYIYIDGVLRDSTTADASGNWSKTLSSLSTGSHTISAKAKDATGNLSGFSATNTFTVDTSAPATPTVTVPVDNQVFTTAYPTFTGTAEANVKVMIYIDDVLRDSTMANGSGNWTWLGTGFSNGWYEFKVRAKDAAGNQSSYSFEPDFRINDSTAPTAPVVVAPANGSTTNDVTPLITGTANAYVRIRVYIDNVLRDSVYADVNGNWQYTSPTLTSGSHNVKATARDAAGNTSGYSNINTFTVDTTVPSAPVVIAPANGSTVATTTPVFSGTAEANSKVRIYVDGILRDSTTANGSGAWSDTSAVLSQGSHNVKVTATDAAGNTSGFSNINTFTIDSNAPSAPVVVAPANGSTVATTTPVFSGTAEANSKVRLYVDGVLRDSTTANGSGAWSDTSAALAQGSHTIKVTATDAAGNTSVYSNTNTFTVDTNAPAAPVTILPANGSTVATTTPVFSGTAEANSKVRIYVDGILKDSVTANGSGAWSDTSAVLTQGSHTVKVTATDAAGNTSVYSNTNTFTVDTNAPAAPVTVLPANGSYVTTTTPLFSGTAEANSKVRIYVDGILKDSVTANGSGAWSDTSAVLTQGSHNVKVTATDAAGNTSVYSNTNTFTVDTNAPSAPVVTAPANGSYVTTTTPTFSGTSEANAKVRLYVDNVLVDSTTANGSGAWSKVSAALAQGSHTIKAIAVDAADNVSGFSNINTFTIDTNAPSAPVVTAPANGSYVTTTTPTFSGTSEANAKVRLYVDNVLVDSTTANGSGAWSKVSAALAQGSHTIKATAVDAAGNVSGFSNINTFTIDTNAPSAPVVTAPANGSYVTTTTPTFSGTSEANAKVRLYVDNVLVDSTTANGSGTWSKVSAALAQGSHTIKATAVDAAGNVSGFSNINTFTIDTNAPSAPVVTAPANGSYVTTTTPTFSGTSEANAKVRLYVDNVLVDSTTANGSGAWSKVSAALAQGSHTIKATAVDAAGNVSGFSNINTFTIDTNAPSAPVVTAPANGSYVTTTTPTFSGTSEANAKVRLYVDNVLVDSTTANGSGAWSKVSAALAQGSHTIKATAVDAAGNVSGFSNTNTFTIDTNAPGAPVVTAPADGSTVTTTTPTFSGTAEANAKVRIYVDNVLVDSTTANGSGAWSKVSAALSQGSHTIKVKAVDAAGNVSGYSNTNTFNIDTIAPNAPVVLLPANSSIISTLTPLIVGTAEPGSKVRIYLDGILVDSTTADLLGSWSKISPVLTQGNHSARSTSTDASGNTSANSNTNSFTVDTGAPDAPVVIAPANGSIVATTTPTFSGTSEANAKVRIYVDNVLVDSTTANGSGAWSKASAALSQGSHTIKATAVDAAENVSGFSNTNTFTIDTNAPDAPVVSAPANNASIGTTTPTFSGTAEPNSKVRIYVDNVLVDSATADGSGNWTATSAVLAEGNHTIKATATDAAGNTSGFSTINTFTVDTTAPSAPVAAAPADGSTLATATPTFSGTAEANSKVRIYVDNVLVDSTTADGSGNWSKASAALAEGSHTVKVTATDAAGNTSTYSNINGFTVDTTAPNAPVVVLPADGSAIATATPTFSGTSEANAKVRLYVDDVLVDSTTANGSGAWSKVSATLAEGSHTIKAKAVDAVGNTSVFSNTNTFTIDTDAPNAPVVLAPANGSTVATSTPTFSGTAEAGSKVRLYVDNVLVDSTTADGSGNWSKASASLSQGSHTIKATATDAVGNTSGNSNTNTFTVDTVAPADPVVVAPADGSTIATTTPTFSGTSEANAKVRLYVDNVLVDSTTANGSGAWSAVSAALSQGSHTIKVTATDAVGNTSGYSNTNTFTIDTNAPNAPIVSTPTDGSTISTATPTFSGTAEANSKVRIYVDGVLKDSTTANGSGNWSAVSSTLNQGSHNVKATSVDAAGNTSGFSNTNTFNINTGTPTAPVIAAPANNSSVPTATPAISGTSDPNDSIKIYIDGGFVAKVVADGSGNWTYTSAALSQGSHTVYATATNVAGTTSPNSATTTFTVDTTAPNAPVVVLPADGSLIATTTPTFSGTAEANSKVRLYVDNVLVDSTTADGSGNWSKVSAALSQGSHTIKATSTDAAGNTSSYSNTNTFTIDTVAPGAPVVLLPADGSIVTTTSPGISGTAEPNSKVRLYINGMLVDSTMADGSGNWSSTGVELGQGSHNVKATSTDAAGNTSGDSNVNTFTIDTIAPGTPVVVNPIDNSVVATTTPTFSGTAEANSKVRLYVDGSLVDSTTANGSGNWSKVSAVLSQGSHTITVTATDAAGNTSDDSNTNTFTVDTVAPNAPVVVLPADGSVSSTTTPTFTGTAEANSKVRLYVDGSLVDSTTANGSGNWSKTSAVLAQGSHTIKATSTDAAGNTSGDSNTNTFTIDSNAPDAPVVVAPTNNSTVTTTTPTFSGTAEANSKVRLYVDDVLVDSTTADGSGNWSNVSAALAQGSHTIKATSVDAAGNVSGYSNTNTFTIDTAAPDAPVVLLPADGSMVTTTTPTFSGTAEANSKVRLYVDGSLVDSTTADGSGNWSKASVALSQGSHTIKATSTDAIGNTSGFSNTNTFTIDTNAPNAPVVVLPADGSTVTTTTPTFSGTAEASSKVRLYVDGSLVDSTTADGSGNWSKASTALAQGSHTIKATATDAAGNTSGFSNTNTFTIDTNAPNAPVVVLPADGSTVTTTTPTFSGTAEASSKVRLYVDGSLVDSTTADGSGNWSKVSASLSQGSHTIKATSTDAAGNTSSFSNTNTFTIDTNAPGAPVVVLPANGSTVTTVTPTFTGTAEASSKVRLYVDDVLVDSTTADGSGNWSKVSASLSQGSHTIKATSTDAAGNTSGYSNTNTFTIDTNAPNAPVVVLPADGSTVTTTTPTFTGTAEANSKVRLYVDGSLVDSTTADGSGNWSKASAALSQGSHTIKATSTDAAGNTSGFSNTNTFTVDTNAPNAPVVVLPADGSTVTTTTPTFSGTAEPNTKVRLYVDGALVDSTTADGSGNWNKVSATLAQGSHTIKATSTDASGNTSGFSNTNTFTIDTVAPGAPVVVLPADGSTVGTTTPTFTGTAEANSKVRLYVDGSLVDSTTADGSGNWSKVSATLTQGSHTIKATSTDAAGNTSGFSNTNTFTIDSTPPSITITSPANGGVTNDATPSITGTTEPNLTVIISIDGVPVDTVVADGSGNWSSSAPTPLTDGPHTVTASATNVGGLTGEDTNNYTVDTIPPSVVITEPVGEYVNSNEVPEIGGTAESNSLLVISIDGIPVDTIPMGTPIDWLTDPPGTLTEGPHTISVTATDPAGNTTTVNKPIYVDTTPPSVTVSSPVDGETVTDNTPQFSGSAEPNILVIVYVDGVRIDSMVATGGTWSTPNSPALSEGPHTVYAIGRDLAGNENTSATNNFTVDLTAPSVTITTPANGSTTNNAQPPITGTGEVASTVVLKVDGSPVDTFVVPINGLWSYNPPSPLSNGPHTAVATATDNVGNSATATSTFTVDTDLPYVTITSPVDGALLGTTTPTISGTAEPFTTVRLYIDGNLVSTFAQNGTGVWNFVSPALAQGAHTTYATSTDAASNMATSNTVNFTIDNQPPTVSVITPVHGSVSTNNTPLFTGTAELSCTVRVYVDSVLKATFVQDPTESWSLLSEVLSDGFHRVYATATDFAGNTATSSTNIFRIVTVPVLTDISPDVKYVGDAPFIMTLTGENFLPTSVAHFNGLPRTTTYVSPTELLAEIPATDMENIDTFDVTVYTPAPGGGTSESLPFAVRGSSITGIIFYDGNKDGVMDGNDFGISGWAVNAVGSNPLNSKLAVSDGNGVYTLTDLMPDTYTLTEVTKPLWTTIAPASGSYTITFTQSKDTTGFNFANFVYSDTGTFRTFRPTDLAEKKSISRKKCNGFRFAFDFTNKTGRTANGIYVEFNNIVTEFTQYFPFEEVQDLGSNAQDYKYLGGEVANGQTVRVSGFSAVTPCKIRINKWWWLWNDTNITKKRSEGPLKTAWFEITLPMPNPANVREELFSSGQVLSYGLIAGVANDQNSRKYAWVDIRKSADMLGTLVDKAGLHSGTPRGFTNGAKKGAIVGRIKKLPPSKFNNKLFGELLTLKFNIWASTIGITPAGFGELIYEEANNPLRGLMLKDIGKKADTMMTYWQGIPESLYINMDTTLRKLNNSFYGAIDTFQFGIRTKVKGIKPLSEVSYLRPNFTVPPVTIADNGEGFTYEDEVPTTFELHQNYPNPFNPSTTISFDIPATAVVTLKLYDILGKEVATLLNNEPYDVGLHAIEFTATDLSSGAYFYRVTANISADEDEQYAGQTLVSTKKMLLVK